MPNVVDGRRVPLQRLPMTLGVVAAPLILIARQRRTWRVRMRRTSAMAERQPSSPLTVGSSEVCQVLELGIVDPAWRPGRVDFKNVPTSGQQSVFAYREGLASLRRVSIDSNTSLNAFSIDVLADRSSKQPKRERYAGVTSPKKGGSRVV